VNGLMQWSKQLVTFFGKPRVDAYENMELRKTTTGGTKFDSRKLPINDDTRNILILQSIFNERRMKNSLLCEFLKNADNGFETMDWRIVIGDAFMSKFRQPKAAF
jgi:hypothetical protein